MPAVYGNGARIIQTPDSVVIAYEMVHDTRVIPLDGRRPLNPAIKQQLCRDAAGDRGWLQVVRPWYGHGAHMHLHFRCPAGQAECRDAAPPPPGDGCDASLQWWFDQLDLPPRPPSPPPPPPPLPPACGDILGAATSR